MLVISNHLWQPISLLIQAERNVMALTQHQRLWWQQRFLCGRIQIWWMHFNVIKRFSERKREFKTSLLTFFHHQQVVEQYLHGHNITISTSQVKLDGCLLTNMRLWTKNYCGHLTESLWMQLTKVHLYPLSVHLIIFSIALPCLWKERSMPSRGWTPFSFLHRISSSSKQQQTWIRCSFRSVYRYLHRHRRSWWNRTNKELHRRNSWKTSSKRF